MDRESCPDSVHKTYSADQLAASGRLATRYKNSRNSVWWMSGVAGSPFAI
jgi:hypothetical protein